MRLTKKHFELLGTLDNYNVEIHEANEYGEQRVCISTGTGVFHWYKIWESGFVSFEQRYSANNGDCSRAWKTGYKFTERIERDLSNAGLIQAAA